MSEFNDRLMKHLEVMVEFAPEDSEKIRTAARMYMTENGMDPDKLVLVPDAHEIAEHLPKTIVPHYYFAWELLVAELRARRVK